MNDSRSPAVAGQFYPRDPETLREMVRNHLEEANIDASANHVVVPHAGYQFSGRTAAHGFAALAPADTFVVVGPDHRGRIEGIGLSMRDWETPLGTVPLDEAVADALDVPVAEHAHGGEHSIEVQLPFLQVAFEDPAVVPVAMGDQDRETAQTLAAAIATAHERVDGRVAVVGSSDLTHYEPCETAERLDRAMLDAVLDLDTGAFYAAAEDSSPCGPGAIATAMELATTARELDYSTSPEADGLRSGVVGYASLGFE